MSKRRRGRKNVPHDKSEADPATTVVEAAGADGRPVLHPKARHLPKVQPWLKAWTVGLATSSLSP